MPRRYSSTRGRKLTLVESMLERIGMTSAGYQFLLHVAPAIDKAVIPRTKGKWSSLGRNRVGLLTSTGAKSGQPRTQPLVCIDGEDDTILLIGSNYGRPQHPGWSANLIAHPECTLEFRGPPTRYRATLLEGEARERAWERAIDWVQGFAAYKEKCAPRQIRVFELRKS
jgi:deazaflavin-dependent oxidoreductase (nitroreductase family)